MPRRPAIAPVADANAAEGGVATLDRALSILAVFTAGTPNATLAEIAERTQIHKSTVLRMLSSLAHAHLVMRLPDGRYALGAGVERLHQVFNASFSLEAVVMPVLEQLVRDTQESAAFHVRQGDQRLCLHRVDSPRPVRDHIRVGDLLPMDRGAGGRVMLAFSGARGALYSRIRHDRLAILAGDRLAEVAGVASPVFDARGLAGSLTLTMPVGRLEQRFGAPVLQAARQLTERLGGHFPEAS